ncbi:hypothetical protein Hypma_005436 [Hypsizygus marmoreus]|uniref:F-box domain-containing protein n=1 Tax=Hypsizygus marmoreus TaxID=39966 RepID=A0A369J866_HYPMA|nr:hypothetical protein Hypma_005436 [Hypsizygus marmoreus]
MPTRSFVPPLSVWPPIRPVIPSSIRRVKRTHINSLPTELLTEIFRYGKDSDDSHALSNRNAPLNYTWVCKYWRNVARGDPRLWTMLEVGLVRKKVPDLVAIVQHYAEGAGHRSLSIKYNFPKKKTLNPQVVRESLRPFVSRIRHLELNLAKYIPLFDAPLPATSVLERFSYTSSDLDATWSPSNAQMADFRRCLQFREAVFGSKSELDEGDIDHHLDAMRRVPIKFPWSQLTSLKILESNLNAVRVAAILRQCTSLVDCELSMGHCCPLVPESQQPQPPTILEYLTSLAVRSLCRREEGLRNGPYNAILYDRMDSKQCLFTGAASAPKTLSLFATALITFGEHRPKDFLINNPLIECLTFSPFRDYPYVQLWNTLRRSHGQANTFLPNLRSLDFSTLALWVHACDYGLLQSRDQDSLPSLTDIEAHQREFSGRSEEIIQALTSRTWSDEAQEYAQPGLAKLEKVTLRTWRSPVDVDKLGRRQQCAGQEWILKPYQLPPLQRRLESCGVVIDFPVEFVDETMDN